MMEYPKKKFLMPVDEGLHCTKTAFKEEKVNENLVSYAEDVWAFRDSGMTQQAIADEIGRSRSWVRCYDSLRKVSPDAWAMIRLGKAQYNTGQREDFPITENLLRGIVKLTEPQQDSLVHRIMNDSTFSSRDAVAKINFYKGVNKFETEDFKKKDKLYYEENKNIEYPKQEVKRFKAGVFAGILSVIGIGLAIGIVGLINLYWR